MSKQSFDETMDAIDTTTLATITGGASQNGAAYGCGPYRLELRGPEQGALFRNGRLLERYESGVSTPLRRNGQTFQCYSLNRGR
jgi:hypothetical protein